MSAATRSIGFRKRLVILGAVALLLVLAVVRKKLLPTWDAWQECQLLRMEEDSGADLFSERMAMQQQLASLDQLLGASPDQRTGWQPVLDMLGKEPHAERARLAGMAAEHVFDQDGVKVHTLPLSLTGRTADVVNTIGALESDSSAIQLIAVDMTAKAGSFNAPRQLIATLYLQTLSR